MLASTSRSAPRLVPALLLVVLVSGCSGKTAKSTAGSKPSTTVAPTTTIVPPMTAKELAWLKAVTKLHKTIDKTFTQPGRIYLTRAKMTLYMNALRSCSRELTRIGSPSDRLQPVYTLVKKACRTFDKGAKCFATAISVSGESGAVTGTANERTFQRSTDCAGAAQGDGSNLLAEAEATGEGIKALAG